MPAESVGEALREGAGEMSSIANSETRNSKLESNSKLEIRNEDILIIRISDFEFYS